MNYIRGAVNAISAPYQYYRDLPPINASTLTGAIDVIVVQRPTADGGSELVCSPFHVKFGKWKVLRPSDKKVDVSVNGRPIPFCMKIGEAGEAFFVFETTFDVPDELITSPIIQPTRPDEPQEPTIVPTIGEIPADDQAAKHDEKVLEPEFFDLDSIPPLPLPESVASHPPPEYPPSPLRTPTIASPIPLATPSTLFSQHVLQGPVPEDKLDHPGQVLHSADPTADSVAYGTHCREESDRTVVSDQSDKRPVLDTAGSASEQLFELHISEGSSLLDSSSDAGGQDELIPFPPLRATSEPPLELDDHQPNLDGRITHSLKTNLPIQEYSWEWGAFPQPSPVQTNFGKGTRRDMGIGNSHLKLPALSSHGRVTEEDSKSHRSHSVPPELEGSPRMQRRELPVFEGGYNHEGHREARESRSDGFGSGGRLAPSKTVPTQFTVYIEKQKLGFELSRISFGVNGPPKEEDEEDKRGRRNRGDSTNQTKALYGLDEVEAARVFDEGKVTYDGFLDDPSIVADERLVIRWSGDQYITRRDGSPLMGALVIWRDAAIKTKLTGLPSRPSSPLFDEDETGKMKDTDDEALSSDERPEEPRATAGKPTSSSWVRWWRRGRPKDVEADVGRGSKPAQKPLQRTSTEEIVPQVPSSIALRVSDTAPASLFSSPKAVATPSSSQVSADQQEKQVAVSRKPAKRFAKTLRLTSDQLRALNLKPGANTITFSLSASGAIACTARIFVWESTDLVVVSDIDGTITKSDGLGHVFAMIGRDWTHVGVAKLYTDISRNGYKLLYLTSRAIGQADATRDYLKGIKQNDYQLPEGPVIMSPDGLMTSLHREVIMRKPEIFKMACLRDIQRLFGEHSRNPFYGGFGNRITDALSYRSVDVPSARIFTIDSSGEVKMELLELAGYKSSYIHMTDLVDQMFPPIHRKWTPEFTDFNYWKTPMQDFTLPELTPPSPALSARSDTSNQSTFSRLRNFSLVGTRQSLLPSHSSRKSADRSSQLRQMSSYERLSNALASVSHSSPTMSESRRSMSRDSRTSTSLTYAESMVSDDEYVDEDELEKGERSGRGERRRSMASMPGSLDEIRFEVDSGVDGGDEDGYEGGEEVEDGEEATEEAFDEDFDATTQMKNVPFL